MKTMKFELELTEEQVKEIFDDRGIKYSKKKFDTVQEAVMESIYVVEDALIDHIQEIIDEEWSSD
jgi:hypothetical protein